MKLLPSRLMNVPIDKGKRYLQISLFTGIVGQSRLIER
jgi:hypothetical protein